MGMEALTALATTTAAKPYTGCLPTGDSYSRSSKIIANAKVTCYHRWDGQTWFEVSTTGTQMLTLAEAAEVLAR